MHAASCFFEVGRVEPVRRGGDTGRRAAFRSPRPATLAAAAVRGSAAVAAQPISLAMGARPLALEWASVDMDVGTLALLNTSTRQYGALPQTPPG